MRVSPDFAPPIAPPPGQEPPGNRPNQDSDAKRTYPKQGWAGRTDTGNGTGNGVAIDYDDGAWM